MEMNLATNTLVLEKNKLGFLQNEPDEQEFLTFDNVRLYDHQPRTVKFFNETTGLSETF